MQGGGWDVWCDGRGVGGGRCSGEGVGGGWKIQGVHAGRGLAGAVVRLQVGAERCSGEAWEGQDTQIEPVPVVLGFRVTGCVCRVMAGSRACCAGR